MRLLEAGTGGILGSHLNRRRQPGRQEWCCTGNRRSRSSRGRCCCLRRCRCSRCPCWRTRFRRSRSCACANIRMLAFIIQASQWARCFCKHAGLLAVARAGSCAAGVRASAFVAAGSTAVHISCSQSARAQVVASCSYSCGHCILIVLSPRCYCDSPARALCIHQLVLLRTRSEPDNSSEKEGSLVYVASGVGLAAAGGVLWLAGAVGIATEAGVVRLAHPVQVAWLCVAHCGSEQHSCTETEGLVSVHPGLAHPVRVV